MSRDFRELDDLRDAQALASALRVEFATRKRVNDAIRVTELADCEIDLLAFFADRLKVHLRDTGARHDLIDAVFALPGQDDLLMIVRRVEALGKFLDTDDGKNLLVGYRRAANILRAEEKKDGEGAFDEPPDASSDRGEGPAGGEGALRGDAGGGAAGARAVWSARISRARCARSPSCGRRSTRSSTRSR